MPPAMAGRPLPPSSTPTPSPLTAPETSTSPKTAGREEYGHAYVSRILEWGRKHRARPESLVRTATVSTGLSILDALHRLVASVDRELLADRLETVAADGHKALVFSQWTSLLDLVEQQALRLDQVETLVLDAYDDVSPKLHPVAQRSLFAHLEKLEVEGRARREGEDWFAPGWTDYAQRIPYRAYDVTALVRAGVREVFIR